jgi:hypothetical protein
MASQEKLKTKYYCILVKTDGSARWQLTGRAASVSPFPVCGESPSLEEAMEVAKESVKGAFARLNRRQKDRGLPPIHGRKKTTPQDLHPAFNF